MTVASTGMTEQMARQKGIDCDKVHLSSASHAGYYPGSSMISIKVLFERGTGRLLGGQFVGFEGVDKRCDVLATAIRAGLKATDLTRLELCYAPPYSSAKDPVNMAGFVMENILTGKVVNAHWTDLSAVDHSTSLLLDVREDDQYDEGHVEGVVHIPLHELRARIGELPDDKEIYVHCHSGLRSYVGCRILTGHGIRCRNLSGGWRLYDALRQAGLMDTLTW